MVDETTPANSTADPIRIGLFKELNRGDYVIKRGPNETQADLADKAAEMIRADVLRAGDTSQMLIIYSWNNKVSLSSGSQELLIVILLVILFLGLAVAFTAGVVSGS